jgi:hypothetical protein
MNDNRMIKANIKPKKDKKNSLAILRTKLSEIFIIDAKILVKQFIFRLSPGTSKNCFSAIFTSVRK